MFEDKVALNSGPWHMLFSGANYSHLSPFQLDLMIIVLPSNTPVH